MDADGRGFAWRLPNSFVPTVKKPYTRITRELYNQADFLTSSTHTPAIDIYKTRHVAPTTSVTKLIARSRSHGFPFSLRLDGIRPAGHSPQLHKHTRRLTRTSPDLGRGACLSVCASHRVC